VPRHRGVVTRCRVSGVIKRGTRLGLVAAACAVLATSSTARPTGELWREVEIVRTAHGVPHVRAASLRAAGYALGWLQCEDYGLVTPARMWATRGQTARIHGRASLDADFSALRDRARAIETFHLLEPETRDFYDGFAAGVNRYVTLHRDEFPAHIPFDFTGYDVATLHIGNAPPAARVRRFLQALDDDARRPALYVPADSESGHKAPAYGGDDARRPALYVPAGGEPGHRAPAYGNPADDDARRAALSVPADDEPGHKAPAYGNPADDDARRPALYVPADTEPGHEARAYTDPEAGSNAWALAPSRTRSGNAILLRNPHLAWTAGYYEAHITVPGVLDFYGDFRIGGPLGVVGGFNRHLGWSTTNSNTGDRTEIYALPADPERPNHYRLDGASLPLSKVTRTVEYLEGEGMLAETRDFWRTPLGPVIHRTVETIYIARTAGDGEFRAGEQFLRLMRATSLNEWMDAMRMRALVSQNYTYADAAGNILVLWNASLPVLPHEAGGDTAVRAVSLRDIWTQYLPFDRLPLTLNPRGGYVHNANDSPHFANVRDGIELTNAYPNMEPPMLRLRSQLSLRLIDSNRRLTLEDVVKLKHDYRMLLAERVKPDLVRAVKATRPEGELAGALRLLERWDDTAAPESRGAVLFEVWWSRYAQAREEAEPFAVPWSEADPLKTPRGLADPAGAAEACAWAVEETARRHGAWDVEWGEVYRIRRGGVDVPAGGCPGRLGCFRVLGFTRDVDGKYAATTGDGWVLAVEFEADGPRAYSVLAYGQSAKPESPWHADQAEMFARGEMKRVAFTPRDVDRQAVVRYRPGVRQPM
jgi:acyl-homoserine-lactone acylase